MNPGDDTTFAPGIAGSADRPGLDWRGRALGRLLSGLECGRLTVVLPSGARLMYAGRQPGPEGTIILNRWRVIRRLLAGGDIGFAEAFIDGDWSSPDLTALIRVAASNAGGLRAAIQGSALVRLANRLRHTFNANSKRGSRRNIEAHYDLGNEFYRLWLDPSMMYSSAVWTSETPDLHAAQLHRLALIAGLLALSGGEHVLEVGCGWGELAATLAETHGARVTGVTLSPSQLAWAQRVAAARGVAGQVDLRIQDYRDIVGQFDRIVSIEMLEAVGEAYWPAYFDTLARGLTPEGLAVLQVITIAEDRFQAYRRDSDFIQKHVFPGGFLPTKTALRVEAERAGLRLKETQCFGHSYALTLAAWRRRFVERWPDIAALGFDNRFRNKWEYYLCYCEAGFLEGWIDVGLYVFEPVGGAESVGPLQVAEDAAPASSPFRFPQQSDRTP
jgi:cyclopropane-fatty-acyl-phospholipid synthase